jgi:hypothetical protein
VKTQQQCTSAFAAKPARSARRFVHSISSCLRIAHNAREEKSATAGRAGAQGIGMHRPLQSNTNPTNPQSATEQEQGAGTDERAHRMVSWQLSLAAPIIDAVALLVDADDAGDLRSAESFESARHKQSQPQSDKRSSQTALPTVLHTCGIRRSPALSAAPPGSLSGSPLSLPSSAVDSCSSYS